MAGQMEADGLSSEPEKTIVSGLGPSSDLTNTIVRGLRTSHTTPYEPLSGPSFRRHTILDLPVEVLERVVSFVDPQGVVASRLTCKQFEKAAVRSFVHHFIKHRRHVISIWSLVALVKITAHAYFGRFVNTIVLDTTFPFVRVGNVYMNATDELLTRRRFRMLVSAALSRLKVHGNSVILGVTDRNPTSFGIKELLSHPAAHLLKQESGFDIESVEDHGPCRIGMNAPTFVNQLSGQLSTKSTLKSLKIEVIRLAEFRCFSLIWDHESRSLEVEGLDKWHGPRSMTSRLFKDMIWPSTAMIKDLTLSECNIIENTDLIQFTDLMRTCLRTLERVKLSGVAIGNDSKWSLLLRQLSRAPHLVFFELDTLVRNTTARINSVAQRASVQHVNSWYGSSDETSSELADLAAIVKSDEDKWESMDDADPRKWSVYTKGRNRYTNKVNQTNADLFG